MALTLILMRHAKSAWDDPTQDDFDRPLNRRGRQAAPAIGEWLVQKGYLPDRVLVSGARRTVETWERMAKHLPETAEMQSAPALYLAEPRVILDVLRSQKEPTVLMIGHNPGFALVASMLPERPAQHPRFNQYPTAATAVFEFPQDTWSELQPQTGTVINFVVPRDLTD